MDEKIAQVRRIIFNDEEIGMGFNSQSGLAVGTALEGFEIPPATLGQTASAHTEIVNSHEQLMSTLGMSFEAQGRYGFFSASAKAQFSESSSYNSSSTFVVASVVVENPLKRGRGFRVTKPAQDLLGGCHGVRGTSVTIPSDVRRRCCQFRCFGRWLGGRVGAMQRRGGASACSP